MQQLMKFVLTLVIAITPALFGAPGKTVTKADVEKLGNNGARYHAAEEFEVKTWKVFGDQKAYKNEEQFSGYGLSTAGALGLKRGWNEMPGNIAVLVDLNPNEPVRYLGTVYYLDNCRVGGKAYKNRFMPLTPVVVEAPPTLAPEPTVETRLIVYVQEPVRPGAPLPVCLFTGDQYIGFDGHPENGTGQFYVDDQIVEGSTDGLYIGQLGEGKHQVKYVVSGPTGSDTCTQDFWVFGKPSGGPMGGKIVATIPPMRWCDTEHDGFRPDRLVKGMAQQIYCHPGGTILNAALGTGGGLLAARAWPKMPSPAPATKTTPPIPSVH